MYGIAKVILSSQFQTFQTQKTMPTEGKTSWMLTINNPSKEENDPVKILVASPLADFIRYVKWAKEEGEEEQTPHIHIYLHLKQQQRFSAIKNVFPTAHIDLPLGTPEQCISYIGNPEYVHADTHPDPAKRGKEKGGICTASGEYGSTKGIRMSRGCQSQPSHEERLLALKEKIDEGFTVDKLWQEDFYIMAKNLISIENYFTLKRGVSIRELSLAAKHSKKDEQREKEIKAVENTEIDWDSEIMALEKGCGDIFKTRQKMAKGRH